MRNNVAYTHNLAALQRRAELDAQADATILSGRTMAIAAQPTMAWVDGPRTQPRGRNGRFLCRVWLAEAELFLPADRAFFRRPLTSTER